MRRLKSVDMLEGPIFRSLIIYALPIMLSGILQILFNAADLAVVGNFAGTDATAAVGATGAFISLIVNTVMGLAIGVNVILARAIGAKDGKKVSDIVHTAITVAIFAGIIVGAVGMALSPLAMQITKCPPDALDKAIAYLFIYFAGAPAVFVYNFGSAILRTKGDTRRPLNFLMLAGILNVILNLIFVTVFNMDADGVALATTFSQYLGAFLTVRCLMKQEDEARLDVRSLRIVKGELSGIIKYGLPSGLTSAAYSLSAIQIQSAINGFGSSAVAGNSAISSLEGFIMSSYNAMGSAAVAFVGQNIGAGKKERIKKVILLCIVTALIFTVVLSYGMLLIGKPLYKIYIPNDERALEIAATKAGIMFTLYFILAASQNLGAISQAFGYSLHITVISLIAIFGVRTVWMQLIFPRIPKIETIFWCFPFTWVLIAVANGAVLLYAYKIYMKKGRIR